MLEIQSVVLTEIFTLDYCGLRQFRLVLSFFVENLWDQSTISETPRNGKRGRQVLSYANMRNIEELSLIGEDLEKKS